MFGDTLPSMDRECKTILNLLALLVQKYSVYLLHYCVGVCELWRLAREYKTEDTDVC